MAFDHNCLDGNKVIATEVDGIVATNMNAFFAYISDPFILFALRTQRLKRYGSQPNLHIAIHI